MSSTTRLAIRLTPRGGREAVDGWAVDGDGRPYLKVRVAAPPVDGAANAALIAFLAKTLGVSRSSVTLASGAGARLKLIDVVDCDPLSLERALGRPPAPPIATHPSKI
ncbi:uncharacterized protein YggU (UPF0235/DUF167 family) [Caulobacter rhizosphaerae]|jgi:uncharacterized protein YggU (UPF0235/DUF167 family)|uniref:UPF0235 protein J2800_001516 n=1 Tax=Caulobacter rhizosphaerae TaxID=2010972 RepID=A0ABU1MX78_9CAUL|nr:DUF167 family protein [Caulobacter rhizosphaerae]MDR6530777.1 uncharacterized protein YggU (UPF0235/DUF167 family) [Caulobacter rhizosphaerae]